MVNINSIGMLRARGKPLLSLLRSLLLLSGGAGLFRGGAWLLVGLSSAVAAAPLDQGDVTLGDAQSSGYSRAQTSVQTLIDAAKAQDRVAIAQLIRYPLKRDYPLAPIRSSAELLARFEQVFDAQFIQRIAQSRLEQDWHSVGARGMMFENGALWLDVTGNIIAVNEQTALEAKQYAALLAAQRAALPQSLREFVRPEFLWHTPRFTVRVDDLGQGRYRYAAWAKGKALHTNPDLILTSGTRILDGSGGNHTFQFRSGRYLYLCHVNVTGTRSLPLGELVVLKDGQTLLREAAYAVDNGA